ncbi:hypothetical protein TNCV_2511151 [Trichonephila clavipes]|nr:hypothetical protein TNCV_2511151 [Trichonephila clavipes]
MTEKHQRARLHSFDYLMKEAKESDSVSHVQCGNLIIIVGFLYRPNALAFLTRRAGKWLVERKRLKECQNTDLEICRLQEIMVTNLRTMLLPLNLCATEDPKRRRFSIATLSNFSLFSLHIDQMWKFGEQGDRPGVFIVICSSKFRGPMLTVPVQL